MSHCVSQQLLVAGLVDAVVLPEKQAYIQRKKCIEKVIGERHSCSIPAMMQKNYFW